MLFALPVVYRPQTTQASFLKREYRNRYSQLPWLWSERDGLNDQSFLYLNTQHTKKPPEGGFGISWWPGDK